MGHQKPFTRKRSTPAAYVLRKKPSEIWAAIQRCQTATTTTKTTTYLPQIRTTRSECWRVSVDLSEKLGKSTKYWSNISGETLL